MTTKKKGAVPALRLNLGGAPSTWHSVGELPGLYHPSIGVPVDVIEGDEAWAKAQDAIPGMPLELVYLTEDEADTGRAAYAEATGKSLDGLLSAITRDPAAVGGTFEAERMKAEHANAGSTVNAPSPEMESD